MEKTNLTEAQSLELITSMINDTRTRLARNSGTPFLIWGYTTIVVSIINVLAIYFGWSYHWNWSWCAIPIVGWVGMLLLDKKEPCAHNYIDRVISIIWCVIGISFAWFMVAAAIYGCSISFLTILVMGAGTIITGLILKDKATTICGVSSMLASLIFPTVYFITTRTNISTDSFVEFWRWGETAVFAVIFLFMMVIPGHILNCKHK
ncbi:MAG: hypothetical protein IKU88_06265 [Alistipes sp.]|nr:hypothetical protein [Alistipes sp.]